MRVTLKLSPKIAIFKSVFSKQINKIEGVQHQKIVLSPFVYTKEQSTASMLTGGQKKDLSTATSPIDSEIFNQSVVTYPIDLENSN